MWDFAFRNIMKQKTRSFLTILGILIGIGAVVGLGSFAEGINNEVASSLELMAGKIMVTEKDSGFFGMTGSLNDDHKDIVASIPGIKEIIPTLIYIENMRMMAAPSEIFIGMDPEKAVLVVGENTEMYEGRELEEGDVDSVIVGYVYAETNDIHVGDFVSIKETDFEVVGIVEKTEISDVDNAIVTDLESLQNAINADDFQMMYVIPEDVRDTEKISEAIEDASEDLDAMTSTDMARQAGEIVDQIRFFTMGIGAIAAVVGGLGVMNTMIMAVMERRKEIGVLKAIGATRRKVMVQFMQESIILSLIGGIGGVGLGFLASLGLGAFSGVMGMAMVTPSLALTGIVFALFLGTIGGFYPSWKASKLDPVEALRYE